MKKSRHTGTASGGGELNQFNSLAEQGKLTLHKNGITQSKEGSQKSSLYGHCDRRVNSYSLKEENSDDILRIIFAMTSSVATKPVFILFCVQNVRKSWA